MRRRLGQHVLHTGAQVVADVGAEKAVGALAVTGRDHAVSQQPNALVIAAGAVEGHEPETPQFLEQAARMHVLRYRAGQCLEARGRALARDRQRLAASVAQGRVGQPAREDFGGR